MIYQKKESNYMKMLNIQSIHTEKFPYKASKIIYEEKLLIKKENLHQG